MKKDFTQQEFIAALSRTALLSGRKVEKEMAQALYEELQGEWWPDIQDAFTSIARNGEFINLGNIIKALGTRKRDHLTRLADKREHEMKMSVDKLIQAEGIPADAKEALQKLFGRSFKVGESSENQGGSNE